MELHKGNYLLSTDKNKLDLEFIHRELTNSYWAPGIPFEIVKLAAEHSLAFGLYENEKQVGYARVISDYATFAYLADVFITESARGRGLSKWMMEGIMSHPQLQGLRRFMLATKDAHSLYEKFGFHAMKTPERMMEITRPDIYKNPKK